MPQYDSDEFSNRIQSAFALLQGMQIRLIHAAVTGGMSINVSEEIGRYCQHLKTEVYHLGQMEKKQ